MSVTWSNDLELTLIEYYQVESILWLAKHPDHKNKMKVHDAWKRISDSMNISIIELKKKKDSLFSSYRAYRKKVRDSIRSGAGSGEIYKPVWFAYEIIDSFFGENNNCNKTIETKQSSLSVNESSVHADEEDEERLSGIRQNQEPMPPTPTIRRRKHPPEVAEAENVVKDALSTLKTTLDARHAIEEDECDLHGKVIAKKLRQIPENERTEFVCQIYNLFVNRDKTQHASYFLPSPSPATAYSSYCEPHMYSSSSSLPEVIIPEKNIAPKIIITSNRIVQPATENPDYGDNAIDNDFKYE